VDAWVTKPSVYAVAARNAQDIAEAVNFAHENDLRLGCEGRRPTEVGKGGLQDLREQRLSDHADMPRRVRLAGLVLLMREGL
jgi:hypothetical protein